MQAGTLTERIEFYRMVTEKTETGSEYNTYVLDHRCRANKTYTDGNRTNENGDIFYAHFVNFEIRQGYDFDEHYRIKWDGGMYRILYIEKNRSRQCVKIVTELIND